MKATRFLQRLWRLVEVCQAPPRRCLLRSPTLPETTESTQTSDAVHLQSSAGVMISAIVPNTASNADEVFEQFGGCAERISTCAG